MVGQTGYLLLLVWNQTESIVHKKTLGVDGFSVKAQWKPDISYFRSISADPPRAIVIDLHRLPSQGRDVAVWCRNNRALKAVPIVFIEGNKSKTDKVRALLPDAYFATWDSVRMMLREAISTPTSTPIVPGTMDAYAGVALPKKLGVRPDSDVSQSVVREFGLSRGFVDYKICSIDDIWSALCFSRRS